jgi:hypothetical protein
LRSSREVRQLGRRIARGEQLSEADVIHLLTFGLVLVGAVATFFAATGS